jgi:hypothetical protein
MFIETDQLQQMISYKPLVHNQEGQQKVKLQLLEEVKAFFADKFYRLKAGTRKAIDFIAWLSSERGFIFASQLYIGEKYGVSDRTIRGIMKQLEGAGLIVKAYRRAKNTNAKGKPVYFFTKHKYFAYWKELLGFNNFQEDFQEENGHNPCESKNEQGKKVSTNTYLNKLRDLLNNKQVLSVDQKRASKIINNNKAVLEEWKEDSQIIASALPKKMTPIDWEAFFIVLETMKNNIARYGNPQSYFATCFNNAINKAKSREKLKPFEEVLNSRYVEQENRKTVPFYNWLEGGN